MVFEADRVPCPTPRLCLAQPTNKLYAGGALSSSNNVAPGPGEMHHRPTAHARWSESSLHARTHALHVHSKAVSVAPHSMRPLLHLPVCTCLTDLLLPRQGRTRRRSLSESSRARRSSRHRRSPSAMLSALSRPATSPTQQRCGCVGVVWVARVCGACLWARFFDVS